MLKKKQPQPKTLLPRSEILPEPTGIWELGMDMYNHYTYIVWLVQWCAGKCFTIGLH